jgi:hypothetical protein
MNLFLAENYLELIVNSFSHVVLILVVKDYNDAMQDCR